MDRGSAWGSGTFTSTTRRALTTSSTTDALWLRPTPANERFSRRYSGRGAGDRAHDVTRPLLSSAVGRQKDPYALEEAAPRCRVGEMWRACAERSAAADGPAGRARAFCIGEWWPPDSPARTAAMCSSRWAS